MNAVAAAPNRHSAEPSRDVFAEAGAFLAQHRLGADPANYAFAFSVVIDPEGPLATTIARLTEGGFRLTGEEIERLGGQPSSGAPIAPPRASPEGIVTGGGERLDQLIARTHAQVEDFARSMRRVQTETHDFGEDLAAAINSATALPAIDEVVRLTTTMIARVRESEVRLATATLEADSLRVALDEARGAARRDPLTDLPNRRAFDEAFAAVAPDTPAAIAICDIDHFKSINDRFGHGVGDRVLRAIGQTIAAECPQCLVARYGGEEFVVLVTGDHGAAALIEATRARIAAKRFRLRDSDALLGSITFSAGLATVRPGETLDDVLTRADVALYAAKASGRNRVERAD